MAIKIIKKNKSILKILNYGFVLITFSWLIFGLIYFYDSYRDQKLIFKTKSSIELYKNSDTNNFPKIGVVNPSDDVKVLRVLFIKDHLVIHVQVNNGPKGWIIKTDDVDLKE